MADMPTPCLPAEEFQHRLLTWFDKHGRHDLPWQSPRSAYTPLAAAADNATMHVAGMLTTRQAAHKHLMDTRLVGASQG